jgi:molybdate transport system substrate-binding protein
VVVIFLISTVSCFAQEITVAVAANVQYAFQELKAVFEKKTGIVIKEIFGSSGKFAAQIENGAPFDIFLSADMDYPLVLYKKGLTYHAPKIYVYGILVLWTLADLDLKKEMHVLVDPAVQKIALPFPQTAPYGRQAINALKQVGLYDQLVPKLVYGESIAQVNQFITSRASDIGFTAKSVVLAPNMQNQGKWIEVAKDSYEPIAQGVVILKHAQNNHLVASQKFYEFLFSASAQEIYQKYGYDCP